MADGTVPVRVATPDEPLPHTALLELALSAMAEVQERAEPGFSPDVAVIPADDWRTFVDAHAEILLLWTAWRDSPYRERAVPGATGCSHCYDGGCGDTLGCGETDRRNAGVMASDGGQR